MNPAKPLVSVLIPSFNHASYIETCLNSLFADGYSHLELLLLDDGSSDNTFEIAERWATANGARLAGGAQVDRQANCGVVSTLNTLLRSARGAYFTLLASDDHLLPGGIQARVNYLQDRPEYLAVFGDAVGIDEEGRPMADSMLDYRKVFRDALRCDRTRGLEIITQWSIPGPVYLARREVLDQIGFYDERFSFEDRDYYLRLVAAKVLGYVDMAVAAYRLPRIKEPKRYLKLSNDRERIESELAPRFKGIERLALIARTQRHRLRTADNMSRLSRFWSYLLKQFMNQSRRINRLAARLMLGRHPA